MERWFEKRRVNKVLEIAYRQMAVALDTVNDLEKALAAAVGGDKKSAETIISRLCLLYTSPSPRD